MSETETMAAFARRLGVARSTVTRAAQAGRLVLDGEGRVCILASLQSWHATAGGRDDMARLHAEARGQQIPAAAGPAQSPAPAAAPDEAPAGADRARHRAEPQRWRNASLRLEMDLEDGRRFHRAAAVAEANALGGALRSAVERLIDQTAPRLAAVQGAADRRRLLQQELAKVRRQLRRELPAALRRLRQAAAGQPDA